MTTNSLPTTDEILAKVQQLHPDETILYRDLNDISCGRLYGSLFYDVLRFNATQKEWAYYDGIVWKKDVGGMMSEKYAKMMYDALRKYVGEVDNTSFCNKVMGLGDRNKRKKMIDDARDFSSFINEQLDSDGNILNCLNGVLDLTTFDFREHSPDDLCSKVARVNYDPDARSDDFYRFIRQVMLNDEEKITYLRNALGYSLLTDAREEKAIILYGATTRNGKSTLIETVSECLGDYAMTMRPESLASRKLDGSCQSGDIARLAGVRFLSVSEFPRKMNLDIGVFKNLTGRDTITARHLYEREFEFTPYFTLFMNTNYLPVITDSSIFDSNRIQVVTFDKHFTEEEQDKGLKARLKQEHNLSGLLNWMLLGLIDYRDVGLKAPETVIKATEEYRKNSDKTQMFFDDCLEENKSSNLRATDIYDAYVDWCRLSGYYSESKKNFFSSLKAKGILKDYGSVQGKQYHNVIIGYSLVDNDEIAGTTCPF